MTARRGVQTSLFVLLLLVAGGATHRGLNARIGGLTNAAARPLATEAGEAYGKLPLAFEANKGQSDRRVQFLARGNGYTLFLTSREAVLALRAPATARGTNKPNHRRVQEAVLRMRLVGAAPQRRARGTERLPGKVNYLLGADPAVWRTDIPTYAKVVYRNVYPGVDLVYYGRQGRLEYDLVVRPGAEPSEITIGFHGAARIELVRGALVLRLGSGRRVRFGAPRLYQLIGGVRRRVSGGYVLRGAKRVGFRVGTYDVDQPLVIDPTLVYSTYLGGSSDDSGQAIAVDPSGSAYVAGITGSADFPTTPAAFQTARAGGDDAYVTKLNATGSALLYSTYIGGSAQDRGIGIAIDAAGNAYVAGDTQSSDYPTTPGAFQTPFSGGSDVFATKLDASGSTLVYSSRFGGSNTDEGFGIALDTVGSAYVAGETASSDFPTTPAAFQSTLAGTTDAFVTKLDPTGSAPAYSTYLGGSGFDFGNAIAADITGSAYVAGLTRSSDFPTTPAAFQTPFAGFADVFVTKLDTTGSTLIYSSRFGGTGDDEGFGVALDGAGSAYASGSTDSNDFPTTPGAFQTALAGSTDAFVTKLDPTGSTPAYSTYLGGGAGDGSNDVAVDTAGSAYATGFTVSTNFPTTPDAFQPTLAGSGSNPDAFVTKLNATGSALVYSSYLGGTSFDTGVGIAVDVLPNPNAFVTGGTQSSDFPTTPGSYQPALAGSTDAFVAKIANVVLPPPPTAGKVTGGGSITVVGGIGSFGLVVERKTTTGPIAGQLQYVNHASGAVVHSVDITALVIAGNTATFSGNCTINGAPCTFTVHVTDNGEPGFTDTFTISVSGGPTEGGTLRAGDIQIRQ